MKRSPIVMRKYCRKDMPGVVQLQPIEVSGPACSEEWTHCATQVWQQPITCLCHILWGHVLS